MRGEAFHENVDIVMGQSPPGSSCNTSGEGLPLLNGPTEFGPYHPLPVQFTTEARKQAHIGDILFCVRGSTTGRMNWADQEYAIGRGIAAIRHKSHPELQPLVRAVIEYNLTDLLAQATGSTFPNVSAGQLAQLWWPPLVFSEQRAIAHILGTLDDKIELNRQMNRTLEAMAQALFKSWFIDFDPVVVNAIRAGNPVPEKFAQRAAHYRDNPDALRLPEDTLRQFPDRFQDSELGPIPEGWEAQKLGNVIDVHDSKRIPLNSRQRAKRKGPYRYYGASGIMDYVDDYIFDGTYILVGEDGTVIDKGDRPVVQYVWGKFWVNNHAHVLSGNNGVSNEHLYLILKNTNVRPFVTGAVQPKISQTNLKRIPITLPKEEVRKSFSDSTKTLFTKYRQNGEECGLLEKLRDTLLPELISGELRVPDADKLLEDAL